MVKSGKIPKKLEGVNSDGSSLDMYISYIGVSILDSHYRCDRGGTLLKYNGESTRLRGVSKD